MNANPNPTQPTDPPPSAQGASVERVETPAELLRRIAADGWEGMEVEDVTSVDLADEFEAVYAECPSIKPVLHWARSGVFEFSGNLSLDLAKLICDARAHIRAMRDT